MEISKGLQREIVKVQSELQKAIMEHQIYRNRLETEPNNPDIPGHMKRIQVYITSLGKSQREVVQRLRTEVEAFTADNANGSKVSIAALLGLNNNHITNNNETKHETAANGFETKSSKEDYEEIVRNGDVHHSPVQDSDCTKLPSPSSVETISGEDDVVAVSMDENSDEKQEEEKQKESKMESMGEEDFLSCLGLITQTRYAELQNRRVERKRRSTANSNFVYLTYNQQPSKRRKLYSYFQSENAPHTRQTTARMNGPSPPPNKTQPAKSTSPPAQTVQTKSLIPVQKSTTRPNILRNADSKVFVNKNKMEDNQIRSSVPSAKSIQQISNKAVHIPGLPSSLTIERIENEPAVCICCRNPDSLTICKNCSSNYHVSCHTRSLVPSRTCPRCVLTVDEEEGAEKDEDAEIKRETEAENKLPRYKKNDKLVATAHASGAIGKARENSEVYKAAGGLHKVDAAQKKCILSTGFVNHLPASTFLIPISSNSTSTSNADQSEGSKFTDINNEQRQKIASHNSSIVEQHSRSSPNITYIQADEQVPHSYQLSGTTIQPAEKHQSYLIIKKITESAGRSNQSAGGEAEDQDRPAVFNYQLPTSDSATLQAGFHPLVPNSLFYDRNKHKKQNVNRSASLHCALNLPKLSNSLNPVSNDYQLDRATLNGRKPWAKLSGGKLCINQSTRSTAETLLPFYDDVAENEPESVGAAAEEAAATDLDNRSKHGSSRAGAFIHSLFPGHNKSYTITSRQRELRVLGPNDRDYPLLRQQLCRAEHELESAAEQPDSRKPAAAVQLQRCALTRFFEHVKLEEAHISAPLGTKLAHKDEHEVGDDEIVREDTPIQRYDDDDAVAQASLLTSCDDDLDEDSRLVIRFPWPEGDAISENSHDSAADKSPVRSASDLALLKPSDDDDFSDQVELTCINESSCAITAFQSVESDDYPTADAFSINTYRAKQQQDDEQATTAAAMCIAQSNLSDLHNEVSVPDDKADTERQDLPSGRRSRSRSDSNSSSSSSGHSDTPEQAMNVNDFPDDFEILAIGLVSPQDKREELRRLESTTTTSETDRSDAATG